MDYSDTSFANTSTQNTQLTMNCNSSVTFSGNANLTCNIAFISNNNFLWTTMTATGSTTQTLGADSSVGDVVLHKGATVTENLLGDLIKVQFTGKITDAQSTVDFNNAVIGTFTKGSK